VRLPRGNKAKMKTKFYLIIALVLALTLSGGAYAYTYTTATGTIGITEPTGDIDTVAPAPGQPDWASVLALLVDWEFWPDGDTVTLSQLNNRAIVIPQAVATLRIEQSEYLNIVLQEYVEEIKIDTSHHITIWAEQGYDIEEQGETYNLSIIAGPGRAGLQGEVPTGNLFVVTPHPAYTDDLVVKVYLTNTAALVKAYQHLNMKLYLEGSVEAGETPDYQLLTLDNGVVTFNLVGYYAAGSYTLTVIGGSFSLNPNDPSGWEAGWSVTPEFYCEVTQR